MQFIVIVYLLSKERVQFFISTDFVASSFINCTHFVALGKCVLCCQSTKHAQCFSILVLLDILIGVLP